MLLVEDNPGDVRLLQEALREAKVLGPLQVVSSGEAALQVLRELAASGDLPDLVLLDLNLPGKTGHEVLMELKADPKLTHLPVVVLTSSASPEDVMRSYQAHATCYITKPTEFEDYTAMAKHLTTFYTEVATLPKLGHNLK
jgi:two-component system, chemotaxis family, response regulator Rcp1